MAVVLAGLVLLGACGFDPGPDDERPGSADPVGSDAEPDTRRQGWPEGFAPDARVGGRDCPDLVPAGEGIVCAAVTVPAARDPQRGGAGPDDAVIRLAVAVLPPLGERTGPPLVYLEGGPGFGALPIAWEWVDGTLRELRRGRAVVLVDQRGTGYTQPSLTCPELTRDGAEDDQASWEDAAVDCRDRLAGDGVDLEDYTSAANAADIAELREALGVREWDLMGSSYGSRLALTVLRDHPDGVRAVTLDGVYPPEADGAGTLGNRQSVLFAMDALVARCEGDARCRDEIPDLRSDVIAALRWLEELAADGEDVDGLALLDAIVVLLPERWLPGLVADLAAEDRDAVDQLLDELESSGYHRRRAEDPDPEADPEAEATAMTLAVNCAEESAFAREATDRVDGWPRDIVALVDLLGGPDPTCDALDIAPAEPIEAEPVRSDRPALVVGGLLDAVTPPAWAELAAASLSDATLVWVPWQGHGASGHPCVVGIIADFLDDPDRPDLDRSCLDELDPLADGG